MRKAETSSRQPALLSRSEAARLMEASVELIDYYANTRRLPYVTNSAGHRQYSDLDIRRLKALREKQKKQRRVGAVSDASVA